MKTITGKLTDLERLPSSTNGNPRYRFRVGEETFRTRVDSPMGYKMGKWLDKVVTVTGQDVRGYLTVNTIELATVGGTPRDEIAARTMLVYCQYKGNDQNNHEENVTDLLTDLIHYCDTYGVGFAAAVNRAAEQHAAEVGEVEPAPDNDRAGECPECGFIVSHHDNCSRWGTR